VCSSDLENISQYGVPVVVAINAFPTDTPKEIDFVVSFCKKRGAEAAVSRVWEKGGNGGEELAKKVLWTLEKKKSSFSVLYDNKKGIKEKIETIARKIYGADGVNFSEKAKKQMEKLAADGFSNLPICIAKTQYSLSDNPALLGRPKNFVVNIRELRLSNGAGFVVAISGEVMTMPGLPKIPAAEMIDVDKDGKISGLF
jgi:formate--tetrahydrofolate ligase